MSKKGKEVDVRKENEKGKSCDRRERKERKMSAVGVRKEREMERKSRRDGMRRG
jgi:hypothetical protein